MNMSTMLGLPPAESTESRRATPAHPENVSAAVP
jgi:hypothetical protein